MVILLRQPKNKRKLLDAAFHGILALLEAIGPTGPNIPNVISNLKSSFDNLQERPEDSLENRAWVWAFKTLSYGVADFLRGERFKAPLSQKKEEAVQEFLNAATQFGDNELDEFAILNPGLSKIFENAHIALKPMILKATTGSDLGYDTIRERFMRSLRIASNRVFCENSEYFGSLEDALGGKFGEGARRDAAWARHAHWISRQFTDIPIFSPDEESLIPLEAVFLPLRCYWDETQTVENADETVSTTTTYIDYLSTTVEKWLNTDPRNDPIRVITGGPGSGKSSFARAFAHKIVQDGKHRVVFIRLQFSSLTGSLYDDINQYLQRHDYGLGQDGNPGLPASPLEWRKADDTPILFVFDGLDELTTKDDDAERYAKEFLLSLRLMLTPLNSDGSPVRAIVLGRNVACEKAMKSANMPINAMINVAPIAPFNPKTLGVSRTQIDSDVIDHKKLADIDQRQQYWQRWALLNDLETDKIPEPVIHDSMSELNVEPLLLHLLVISRFCGDEWKDAAENRNVVYEDIILKIFDRNKKKDHFRSSGIDRSMFFSLMECLGIAAWRGNGRTGGEEDFRKVRKLHIDKEKHLRMFDSVNLESVALNIHTRAGTDDNKVGFEFIHKSFGEYLAARGLLFYAIRMAESLSEKEPEDIEKSWCDLIQASELTPEIIRFLYDEARRCLTQERAKMCKNSLVELIDFVIENGFSVHKISPEISWNELEQLQRCSTSALLAAASACAVASNKDVITAESIDRLNTKWGTYSTETLKRIFETVGVFRELPVSLALRQITFSGTNLWAANLSRANLEGADFSNTNLIWSMLIGTNLQRAILKRADLRHATLINTKMKRAVLCETDLEDSLLVNVDFSDSDLTKASLQNVNRKKFKMNGVAYSSFRNSNDDFIDFEGATMTETDISGANLALARGLTIKQLKETIGDKNTILPKYIDRKKLPW